MQYIEFIILKNSYFIKNINRESFFISMFFTLQDGVYMKIKVKKEINTEYELQIDIGQTIFCKN